MRAEASAATAGKDEDDAMFAAFVARIAQLGLDVPEAMRRELFVHHRYFLHASGLLRQADDPALEPAETFDPRRFMAKHDGR